MGGKAAEGAIFVDAFFKRTLPLWSSGLFRSSKKPTKRSEILEALGYDAAKFIKDILQAKLISSPLQLKEEIQKIQNFQGFPV